MYITQNIIKTGFPMILKPLFCLNTPVLAVVFPVEFPVELPEVLTTIPLKRQSKSIQSAPPTHPMFSVHVTIALSFSFPLHSTVTENPGVE